MRNNQMIDRNTSYRDVSHKTPNCGVLGILMRGRCDYMTEWRETNDTVTADFITKMIAGEKWMALDKGMMTQTGQTWIAWDFITLLRVEGS